MLVYPVGLDIQTVVCVFIYIHTVCIPAANALASLRICAGSPEHSLLDKARYVKTSHDLVIAYE